MSFRCTDDDSCLSTVKEANHRDAHTVDEDTRDDAPLELARDGKFNRLFCSVYVASCFIDPSAQLRYGQF